MAEAAKQQALISEILADARHQAERKVHHAQQESEQMLAAARQNAQAIERDTLDAARKKLERETTLILATVPHEKQIRTLKIQEEVITGIFDHALDSLKSGNPAGLADVLARLSVQALRTMHGDQFTLHLNPGDAQRFGAQVAQKAAAELRAAGRGVQIETASSPDLPDGGVIVRSADGREMVDNSFATRLRRARQTLRGQIAALLFGETQSE